jgi:acyl-coenzyme A synthetase/AMP-(fatty) acid ligase
VEKLIEGMEGVHQACVVPAPHETKNLAPFAFVVVKTGSNLSEQAVKAYTLAHGPAYAHPRHVRFIDAIPLAGTNKPDRKLLTELARVAILEKTQYAGQV